MAKLESMDILVLPTPEQITIGEIINWMVSMKKGKDNKYHVIFEAVTPKKILNEYDRLYKRIDLKCDKHYTLAPKGVMNKWKKQRLENEKKE